MKRTAYHNSNNVSISVRGCLLLSPGQVETLVFLRDWEKSHYQEKACRGGSLLSFKKLKQVPVEHKLSMSKLVMIV